MITYLPSKSRIASCKLLVVGDLMLDRYWHGDVTRISPEAPVPVVHIQQEDNRLGGAGNVALNARTLGARVTLLSVVGQDNAARMVRQMLERYGIQAELGEDRCMETIVKLRVIGRNQQMIRVDFEKKPDHEVLAEMLERFEVLLPKHDAVLFSDYGKGGLTHISRMIALARRAGKLVIVDPKGSDWASYEGASVITPNRLELMQVVGGWSTELQLREKVQTLLKKLRLQALLLTRSENGMTLFEADCVKSVPAHALEVADVTGAGDTVIATMALMVTCGLSLYQAMVLANRAGGLVVAKFGTASLSYDELYQAAKE